MKYMKLTFGAAVLTLALAASCDSNEGASGEDAGTDVGQKGGAATAKQKAAPDPEKTDEEETERRKAQASESGTLHEEPPLEVDGLLTSEDVRKIAGERPFRQSKLPGREPSPTYNALRLRPAEGGGYGAGIQLWSTENGDAARKRLDKLRTQYLNAEKLSKKRRREFGKGAFISKRGGIRNLVFATSEPARVAAVSCSIDTCTSRESLVKLGGEALDRIRTSHAEGTASDSDPKGAESKDEGGEAGESPKEGSDDE